jgi:preprotein translocase subunit SecF
MELFKNTNFDFLGKKWPFIIASLALLAWGLIDLTVKGGPRYGIDFRGGTLMNVKFTNPPKVDQLRSVLSAKIPGEISVVEVRDSENEVIIGTELKDEKALDQQRRTMVETLGATYGATAGKLDINTIGTQALAERLRDILARAGAGVPDQQVLDMARAITTYRDTPPRSGVLKSLDELSKVPGLTPAAVNGLKQEAAIGQFAIRNVEIVGPRIGAELRNKAILATLYALGGMLVYIAFRFEWVYGVAAVVAVFHDTLVTVGLFSIFNKEISLTVVAALLTLVGYSMNDTIVVFDRIRENLKLYRREPLPVLVNKSINQTLSRTVLTSGLTFLTCIALFLFGGQVLNGFAFALVAGILVGTYSSVFIASPIVVFWQEYSEKRKRRGGGGASPVITAAKEPAAKGSAKAVK